jgi:hypothetical protein
MKTGTAMKMPSPDLVATLSLTVEFVLKLFSWLRGDGGVCLDITSRPCCRWEATNSAIAGAMEKFGSWCDE